VLGKQVFFSLINSHWIDISSQMCHPSIGIAIGWQHLKVKEAVPSNLLGNYANEQ